MTALNLGDGKISHRQQIIQLFRMAIAQEWQFSYLSVVKNHIESHPIRLVSVSAEDATFGVDTEIAKSEQGADAAIMFRAQSGGLSIVFKTRIADASYGEPANKISKGFQIELPFEVNCTQLRKTARLDLEAMPEEVGVVLYLSMGARLTGTATDISTSGARFKVHKDVSEQLRNLQALDACRVELPGDFVLQSGAQLLGFTYDEDLNVSTLRCQFVGMSAMDEDKLEKLIDSKLDAVAAV